MLTVLIPTYNRPRDLRAAVRSSITAFGPDVKVIIGDNGNADVTRDLLLEPEFKACEIQHLVNPPGSTYVDNLRILIKACQTEWLTILHDDDFFVGEVKSKIQNYLVDESVDFLFSDHYVANPNGELLLEESARNSEHYGRAALAEGMVENLPSLIVRQRVCLDGFFVRTRVAKQAQIPENFRVFADNVWLFRVGLISRNAAYSKGRLFAYRLSEQGLTAKGFDQLEALRSLICMRDDAGSNSEVAMILQQRLWKSVVATLKWAVKRCRPNAGWVALKTAKDLWFASFHKE